MVPRGDESTGIGELTDRVGVHGGSEESDNEKIQLEHVGAGGVVTGW